DAQLAVNAALDQGAVVAREKARSRRRALTYLGAVAALLLLVGSFVAWAALGGLSRSPQPKEAALAAQPASTTAASEKSAKASASEKPDVKSTLPAPQKPDE